MLTSAFNIVMRLNNLVQGKFLIYYSFKLPFFN